MQLKQSRARRALPPASSGYKLCLVPWVEGHHSVIFLKPSDLLERGTQRNPRQQHTHLCSHIGAGDVPCSRTQLLFPQQQPVCIAVESKAAFRLPSIHMKTFREQISSFYLLPRSGKAVP